MKHELLTRSHGGPSQISGERLAELARILGFERQRFARLVKSLVGARLIAPLDQFEGDDLALLVLTALFRPDARDVVNVADALLRTTIRMESGGGPFVESDPQNWTCFTHAPSVLSAGLSPATAFDKVSVGIEHIDGDCFLSVGFIVQEMKVIWGAPVEHNALLASALLYSGASLGGQGISAIAGIFQLNPPQRFRLH